MSAILTVGSRVGVVAPSHAWDPARYAAGLRWLEETGFDPVEVGLEVAPHRRYAADDAHRLGALIEALQRDDLDGVWALRGGSGVTRILRDVPWEALPSKPILGFSDLTPLLDAWAARGHVAVHGPVVHSLGITDAASLTHLRRLLAGEDVAPLRGQSLVAGEASGPLVGGNLALIAATCGTPFQLDADGALLVLEDIGEAPYKIERMLAQLRDSGVLDGIAGVVLGDFVACDPPAGAPWSLLDAFHEWLGDLGVPVLTDVPIGHGAANRAFVVRREGRIEDGRLWLGS